jgi:hypothetical protein
MLMLVLTLASSLETLTIVPKADEFSIGLKKKNCIFAANLVTRMLWFLWLGYFPYPRGHDDPRAIRAQIGLTLGFCFPIKNFKTRDSHFLTPPMH